MLLFEHKKHYKRSKFKAKEDICFQINRFKEYNKGW